RLEERDRILKEVQRLVQAGDLNGAAAALGKKLEIERTVLGEGHEDVVATLGSRARVLEAREDWAAARADLQEVLAVRQRAPHRKDWQVDDARRALEDLDRRAAMTPEQRQRLKKAEALDRSAGADYQQGKFDTARVAALEVLAIRREILGE